MQGKIPSRAEAWQALDPNCNERGTVCLFDKPGGSAIKSGEKIELVGEIGNGSMVTIWSEIDGYCYVEYQREDPEEILRGYADARNFRNRMHRVLINMRLSDPVSACHKRIVNDVAAKFGTTLVQSALREGRTFAHLTLCYDLDVDPNQLKQLMELLDSFAKRSHAVPIRMAGAGSFGDSVVFLDVDRTHPDYARAVAIHSNLMTELRSLPFVPASALRDGDMHWHATAAMAFDPHKTNEIKAFVAERAKPIDCHFDNISIMAKVGLPGPYSGTALSVASFPLQGP